MNTMDDLRGYLEQPVKADKLKTILKYGNKAPNAGPLLKHQLC